MVFLIHTPLYKVCVNVYNFFLSLLCNCVFSCIVPVACFILYMHSFWTSSIVVLCTSGSHSINNTVKPLNLTLKGACRKVLDYRVNLTIL